jgi:hypothetical protein
MDTSIYPNHDVGGSRGTYWQTRLSSGDYSALIDNGFHPITTHPADGYKRADSKGRVVTVLPCGGSARQWRVHHDYLNHHVGSTFDLTREYADDLLKGRGNDWLFLSYPKEV